MVRIRFVVQDGDRKQVVSPAVAVQSSKGTGADQTAALAGPSERGQFVDSVLAGYSYLGIPSVTYIPPCYVDSRRFGVENWSKWQQGRFTEEAEQVRLFLVKHPDFPFSDCLRVTRAVALAAVSDPRARDEFVWISKHVKDAGLRDQASDAVKLLRERE